MGRPGQGSSGGSSRRSSSSFSSSSRSSSGFRVSSSRPSGGSRPRPGSSGSFSSHRSSFSRGGVHVHAPRYYGGGGFGRGPGGSILYTVLGLFLVIFVLANLVFSMAGGGSSGSISPSTVNREKYTGVAYSEDCIHDELGYINDARRTAEGLQKFYNSTGVQPYVALFEYNSDLVTDSDKTGYAEKFYDDNIGNEGTFMYCYFAESDPNAVGYMVCVNGTEIGTVMDTEAVHIFQEYVRQYWYSDMEMDELMVTSFAKTGERIMTKTTTGMDVMKIVAIIGVVIVGAGVVIAVMKIRRKHESERNEETARILNADINRLSDDD